jgi:hypothetical protein
MIFFLVAVIEIYVKALIACPLNEIVKKHQAFAEFISAFPLVLRLIHVYAPFFHDWCSYTELFKCDYLVFVFFNSLKGYKVLIVLSQVLEKEAELRFFDVVLSPVPSGV